MKSSVKATSSNPSVPVTTGPGHKVQVIYEVYWRRFAPRGDCAGIIERLDYLAGLGVDMLWITPMYPSPMVDGGYDVADYRGLHVDFGSRDDFARLVREADKRGMGVMVDGVFNHCSDQHPWFVAASNPEHPEHAKYLPYFIWREGSADTLPDEEPSAFGGPRWRWVASLRRWALHSFAPEQLDLNWCHEPLRQEVCAIVRYWRDEMGVRGYRYDVIQMIDKEPGQPHLLGYLRELAQQTRAPGKPRLTTVGEMPSVTVQDAARYTDPRHGALDMVFSFDLPNLHVGPGGKFEARPFSVADIKRTFSAWQTALEGRGWNSVYLGNHDWSRIVSRLGDPTHHRRESATLLATLQFTHLGTKFVYQGEELGLVNTVHPTITGYEDVECLNYYQAMKDTLGEAEALRRVQEHSRDASRGRMPWHEADSQVQNSDSVFSYYRRLIALHRAEPLLHAGSYRLLPTEGDLYVYERSWNAERARVILNFGKKAQTYALAGSYRLLIANYPQSGAASGPQIHLRPYEARVYVSR